MADDRKEMLDLLIAQDRVRPPLEPPAACTHCLTPLPPDKRAYRECHPCYPQHPRILEGFAAATYAVKGTPAWDLLLDAKFKRVPPEVLDGAVRSIAASTSLAAEVSFPRFFTSDEQFVAILIPSRSGLMSRCAEAWGAQKDWPRPTVIEGLTADSSRPHQTGLSLPERREAAQGKYECNVDLGLRHVLLIDDVYTTGHTIFDAARAVLAAGAESVSAVVYARYFTQSNIAMEIYSKAVK
ncbi:MAG: hypothetical protein EXQ81_02435 [Thermoleophilia bacterium]|nr:hypothetical protein [Thermoleophilia bacterium]